MSCMSRSSVNQTSSSPTSSSSTLYAPSVNTGHAPTQRPGTSTQKASAANHFVVAGPNMSVVSDPASNASASRIRNEQSPSTESAKLPTVSETRDVEMIDGRPKDIYDRFTKRRKAGITAIVSYSAFLSPVASSVFLPSIPVMSVDLHTTAAVIDYTVAIFVLMLGIAPLLWSPLSGFYGRKPVYLVSMPIMTVASVGVALSPNVGAIIGTRILQAFGGSCVLAVGAGTIGDIYRPTERANAMGWYYSGALMGPAFSPLVAGLFTEYTKYTWRATQYWLVGCSALAFVLTLFFLPETSHPPLPHDLLKQERGKKFVVYRFNPFSILKLFRYPNICAITLVSSFAMLETYCFIVPISTIFAERYNITNVAVSGCLYIANGGGNFLGSRIGGPWADATVRRYLKKRGYRRPEDRLKASFIGLGIGMPLSSLAYGWLIHTGAGGLGPPLVFMITNGLFLMTVLTPVNTYAVDVMQKRSAEVIAVNNFIRYVFAAAASAFVLPMGNAIGWGWTMTIASVVCWIATGVLYTVEQWGSGWREATDKRLGIPPIFVNGKAPEAPGQIEEKAGAKDEEADIGTVPFAQPGGEPDHNEADHGDLTALPTDVRKTVPITGGEGKLRPGISRQSTRTEMPPVQQVLSRTASLAGGSVHGGG